MIESMHPCRGRSGFGKRQGMKLPSSVLSALLLPLIALVPSVRAVEPAPGQQVERSLKVEDGNEVPFLLYLPEDYATREGGSPLMLFLHGRGESYGPLSLVKQWGPPRLVDQGEKLPYVLVSPQCPKEGNWSDETRQAGLVQLLNHIEKTYRVDKQRVYLTGLSMGGYGTWRLAADEPKRFAAAAPVCGGGNPEDAGKLKNLPIWVFHGTEDKAVPLERSTQMVDAIRAAGGTKIRFTTLEHIGHNSWSATYATPELYQWFDQHVKE